MERINVRSASSQAILLDRGEESSVYRANFSPALALGDPACITSSYSPLLFVKPERGRHEQCDNNVQGAVQPVILGQYAWVA